MTERSGIICAGNWIVDLVHEVDHWPDESELVRIRAQTRGIGGGPANVISALARLQTGLPLWPMGALGDDVFGDFVVEECRALGLGIDQLIRKAGLATAHTHVVSVPAQSRTFFYQGGANDALGAPDFPAGTFALTKARVFYLGYLTLLEQLDRFDENGLTDAAHVLDRAQRAGLITCVDLVSAPRPDFAKIVRASAPFIDYLVLNETEASLATGLEIRGRTQDALPELGQALLALGVCKAAVVHCAEAAHWAAAGGSSFAASVQSLPSAEIASHLGAGDAFCAGLIYAIHEDWPPQRALALANAIARASLRGVTATSAIPKLSALDVSPFA